ncbi:MAG TPA: GNAT family N-acetyltransferase [Candidatus Nanoarchaeia archaeon]|nr:GNAT family N-acetyltransferase [Candidatus Nanoarchaeia archaeon]
MDEGYLSRPMRDTDRKGIIALCAKVFGKDKASALRQRMDWLFLNNPALKAFKADSWVVENKREIVGNITITPAILRVEGRKARFVWGGNLMADTDHRGRGIGKEMVRRWKEEHKACFALGVGDVAFDIERNMGWKNVNACKAMVKILKPEIFVNAVMKGLPGKSVATAILNAINFIFLREKRAAESSGFLVKKTKKFDIRADRLWASLSNTLPIAIDRDSGYLNWRFCSNPARRFDILLLEENKGQKDGKNGDQGKKALKGYCVFTTVNSDRFLWGRIVELVIDPSDERGMQQLISAALSIAKKKGCDGVQCYGLLTGNRRMLSKNGFVRSYGMDQRFIIRIDSETYSGRSRDYFLDEKNWFISAGDSDFTA